MIFPEGLVVSEDPCERPQETTLEVRREIPVRNRLQPEGVVDDVEERSHVAPPDVRADNLEGLVDGRHELIERRRETGSELVVQDADSPERTQRRQQFTAPHLLSPADTPLEHEITPPIGRHHVERLNGRRLLPVAEDHVRGNPPPTEIEDLEAIPLPVLVGVEMEGGAEAELRLHPEFRKDPLASRQPLEAVDDKTVAVDVERTCPLTDLVPTDADLDVGNLLPGLEGSNETAEIRERTSFSLVVTDLDVSERAGIDDPAEDHLILVTDPHDVEGSVEDFDLVCHFKKLQICGANMWHAAEYATTVEEHCLRRLSEQLPKSLNIIH